MQRLRHQFLADAGFTRQQHRQLAVADDSDFLQQPLVRRTLADQRGRYGFFCRQRAVGVGALALVLGPQRQALDTLHHADSRRRQTGKRLHIAQVHL